MLCRFLIRATFVVALLLFDSMNAFSKPNILVFMSDDQTMTSFDHMDYLQSRPYGSWVTFTNAFLHTPLCCPSRATFHTGKYSELLSPPVKGNNDGPHFNDKEALGLWLHRAGYRTFYAGKYVNGYLISHGKPPGWDEWHATVNGDPKYYDYDLYDGTNLTHYGKGESDYQTDVLNGLTLKFLNSFDSKQSPQTKDSKESQTSRSEPVQPFFVVVSYFAPHGPRLAPIRYNSTPTPKFEVTPDFNEEDISDKPTWMRTLKIKKPKSVISSFQQEYRMMRAVDDSIKSIIELLQKRGMLENTVIFFFTDNGISVGSHRVASKIVPYEQTIRTPLMIRYPGAVQRKDDRLVSNVDWNPTIVEIAGAEAKIAPDGVSLLPLLLNHNVPWRDAIFLAWRGSDKIPPKYYGIRTQRYKYIEYDMGDKELYDLEKDPYEMDNRAGLPAFKSIELELAAKLVQLKKSKTESTKGS